MVEELKYTRAKSLRTLKLAKRWIARGEKRGFLTPQRRWLGALYRHQIERGEVAPVEVRYCSLEVGKGLYALRDFEPEEYLGIYTGILRRRRHLSDSNNYCLSYPTGTFSLFPLMIDASEAGNAMRYINHSDDPNVEMIGVPVDGFIHMVVRTIKPVPKDHQFLFDYGEVFWKGKSPLRIDPVERAMGNVWDHSHRS